MMKRLGVALFGLVLLGGALTLCSHDASAASTIDTSVPAQGAPMASAPIRNNFVAAASDIVNLQSMFATNNCSLIVAPSVGQDCLNINATPAIWYKWTGSIGGWAVVGTINFSTGVFAVALSPGNVTTNAPLTSAFSTGNVALGLATDPLFTVNGSNQLALAAQAAGCVLSNATNASAEPTCATWNSFANQAIGNTNGMLPYRTGGSWGTIQTGTAGATIPLNSTANIFSAAQTVNLNAASLPAAQVGTVLHVGNVDGTVTRSQLDSFAAASVYSCVRADNTAASPSALQSADEICSLNSWGYDGTAFSATGQAAIRTYASQNWSVGAHGTYLRLATTSNGGTTLTDRFSIENDGGMTGGGVLGVSKGSGTINISGLYYVSGNSVAASAASPVVLNSTTGQLTCPTCVTSSGGGAITGTAPVAVSAAGVVSINTNGITYALFQQVAASSLVGNPTGSLANAQGVTLGSTLAFSGSALQTAAGTGDVTWSSNSFATTLGNIPTGVTMAGRLLATNIVAPSTPASGKTSLYVDSTQKVFWRSMTPARCRSPRCLPPPGPTSLPPAWATMAY